MKALQSRKKRPNLEDAKKAVKSGIVGVMSSDDFISDEERLKILEEVEEDLLDIVKKHFPRTRNLEYAILKSHLIIEHALTQHIRCSSFVLMNHKDLASFTFSEKLKIAAMQGFCHSSETDIPSIKLLNNLRNQVAHKFSFDRDVLETLISINSEDLTKDHYTDTQCISFLRGFCAMICGQTAGYLSGYLVSQMKVGN